MCWLYFLISEKWSSAGNILWGPGVWVPLVNRGACRGRSLPGPVDLPVAVSCCCGQSGWHGRSPVQWVARSRPVWRLLAAGQWDCVLLCPTQWLQSRKHPKHHGHLPTMCCSKEITILCLTMWSPMKIRFQSVKLRRLKKFSSYSCYVAIPEKKSMMINWRKANLLL